MTSPVIPETGDSTQGDETLVPGSSKEEDSRADAAAGGFEDLLVPPQPSPRQQQQPKLHDEGPDVWAPRESENADPQRASFSSASSSSNGRSSRRREGPRGKGAGAGAGGGLNAPRNPHGSNPFAQSHARYDDVDGL